ncbi:MAG: hypothetical protein GXO50_05550 [Chlorobi bacterium]|nr:hypothetical protein [Chlorobiota bacterium]
MKIKKRIIITGLFFASLLLFGSCYTKKKGVVPCPTWGQTDNTVKTGNSLTG